MTERAVAPYKPESQEVADLERPGNRLSRDISTKDVAALKSTFAKDLTDSEMRVVVEYCRRTGLDPIAREVHIWKDQGRLTLHIGIDGLRRRAMETGLFEGLELQWCGPDGNWRDEWLFDDAPYAARCVIYRRGSRVPFKAVVRMSEFRKTGPAATNWNTKPAHMLGIRAQTHAFRMAFPQETGPLFDALPRNVRGDIEVVDSESDEGPESGQYVAQLAAPGEYDDAIDVTPAPRQRSPYLKRVDQSTIAPYPHENCLDCEDEQAGPDHPPRPRGARPAEEVFAEDESTPWDEEAPADDMILAAVDDLPPPPEAPPAPAAAPAPEPEKPRALPRTAPQQHRIVGTLTAATGDYLTIEREAGSPVTARIPSDYAGLRPNDAHVGAGITVIVSGKQAPFTLEQIGSLETPNRAQGALV